MSYIRSTSNPERLYIYATIDNTVHIHHGVRPPLSSPWKKQFLYKTVSKGDKKRRVKTGQRYAEPPLIVVPTHIFEHVCRRWRETYGQEHVAYRGLVVEEVHIHTDTGRPVPKNQRRLAGLAEMLRRAFLIRLAYKGQFFCMWRVTWEYVTADVHRGDSRGLGFRAGT